MYLTDSLRGDPGGVLRTEVVGEIPKSKYPRLWLRERRRESAGTGVSSMSGRSATKNRGEGLLSSSSAIRGDPRVRALGSEGIDFFSWNAFRCGNHGIALGYVLVLGRSGEKGIPIFQGVRREAEKS